MTGPINPGLILSVTFPPADEPGKKIQDLLHKGSIYADYTLNNEYTEISTGWVVWALITHKVPGDGNPIPGEIHWTSETGTVFIGGQLALYAPDHRELGYPLHDSIEVPPTLGTETLPGQGVYTNYAAFSTGAEVWEIWNRNDPYPHEVHQIYGAIYQRFKERQAQPWRNDSPQPRWPTTDELPTPDGRGRFQHFRGGSIYWTPETGAHFVYGPAKERWAELGWERSYLRYPTEDSTLNGDSLQLERGYIYTDAGGQVEVPSRRVIDSGKINTPDGFPVNGRAVLAIFSNGVHSFSGKIHDSGAPSYDVGIAMAPRVVDAQKKGKCWVKNGDVEGSLIWGGNRDYEWDSGFLYDPWIADNWDQLDSCEFTSMLQVHWGAIDFFKLVGSILAVPAAAVGVIAGGIWLAKNTDGCGGYDENGEKRAYLVRKGTQCPAGTSKQPTADPEQ